MIKKTLFWVTCCALLSSASAVESDPAGFVTLTLLGNTDSYIYIPFKRTPSFVGMSSSLTGGNVINIAGTPGFTASQFVYAAGTQPNRYYVFLKSGTRTGVYYTITANDTASITVDTAGDDLSSAITSTTSLEIIPYDTLGTVFPGGAGVHPSSSHSASPAIRQSSVLIPDQTTAGKNLAFPVSYYYYSGASAPGPGWRKAGVSGTLANDDVLPPDTFFAIRHNIATNTTLTFTGTVQMSQLATPVGTIANSTDQDNAVALPFATEMTLAQLKLYESGAFVGSSTHSAGTRQDVVLVWDNSVTGKNKAADTTYYYYTGANAPGPGWRKSGVSGTLADNDVVVGPNKCIMIRKKGTASAATFLWSVRPPYVPTN